MDFEQRVSGRQSSVNPWPETTTQRPRPRIIYCAIGNSSIQSIVGKDFCARVVGEDVKFFIVHVSGTHVDGRIQGGGQGSLQARCVDKQLGMMKLLACKKK